MNPSVKHLIYQMHSREPALVGDTASWFRFYKWDVEGETFVPRRCGHHLPAMAGDYLWLFLDDELVGVVPLLRVLVDPMEGTQELWYDPACALVPKDPISLNNEVVEKEGPLLLSSSCLLKRHLSSSPLPAAGVDA